MVIEKCLICGEELNLFSKDPITGLLCFNCYQKQSEEWRNKILENKDNTDEIKQLINEIIPDNNENKEKNDSDSQKTDNTKPEENIPFTEEKFYFSPDMKEEELLSLIHERVRILDKMRFYTAIKNIQETPEFIMLDIIKHQLEVLINQNQLIINMLLKDNKKDKNE